MAMTISRPNRQASDQNHDKEPNAAQRSCRIDVLLQTYWTVMGEAPRREEIDPYEVAGLVTDLRHWCDHHGQNFYALIAMSYRSYLEERGRTLHRDFSDAEK